MADFKPNMMPLLYWSLAYGAAAGVLLFILFLLSNFITIVWFPVFLAGVVWGGWRNYKQQKKRWYEQAGVPAPAQSPLDEFKQAASDIATSSQELLNQTETSLPPQEELPPEGTTPADTGDQSRNS